MESPALINIDSRRHRVPHTFGGITLTMKDLAKIGRLYLNRGVWNGQRKNGYVFLQSMTPATRAITSIGITQAIMVPQSLKVQDITHWASVHRCFT